MAFRALLFSKGPETNTPLTAACHSAGIDVEVCDDIFSAIEKGTRQPFSCVLADWSNQPEAGFLFKRMRESAPNLNVVAIAIVDREPAAAEMRDHRLNLLIYRPIGAQEAQEVLAKALEKMPPCSAENPATHKPTAQRERASTAAAPDPSEQNLAQDQQTEASAYDETTVADGAGESEIETDEGENRRAHTRFPLGAAFAVLALAAAYCLWSAHSTLPNRVRWESPVSVFKQLVAVLFDNNASSPSTAPAVSADTPQDPNFGGSSNNSDAPLHLGIVPAEAEISQSHFPLRQPSDFPLPAPGYEQPAPTPVKGSHATIPDSLRGSAPITPPVVVTVNPAQMLPVSSPMTPPISTEQSSEPAVVSEEAARARLVHSVNPIYPPGATAQKLRGPVILQAIVGRDGSVEDLKIVRGSFVLSKAAIAAVKQWRFQPYTVNGRPAQMQTLLTVNFDPAQ